MRLAALLAASLLVTLPGCLESGDDADDDTSPLPAEAGFGRGEWPSGQSARDLIESYIMTHPFRVEDPAFSTFMDAARTDLVAVLESFGNNLTVTTQAYDGGVNILAIQNGTERPDEWVVLSAHYDSVGYGGLGPTVYGAWDDGAGTALVMELARSLSTWEFPFTIVYAFFDGEEKGLVGSGAFVDAYHGSNVTLLANLNTDPPGLNWPCGDPAGPFAVKVIEEDDMVQNGTPGYPELHAAIEAALTLENIPGNALDRTNGIPVATVAGTGVTGGSDHLNFGAVGVPNVFLGGVPLTIVNGNPNENTAGAMTYPLHTPIDTLQAMEARCVEGSLAGGLQVVADLFTNTLSVLAGDQAVAPPSA